MLVEHRTTFMIVSGQSVACGEILPPPSIVDVTPTALYHLSGEYNKKETWNLDGIPVGLPSLPSPQILRN
jgi:hypothetical protein